MAAGEGVSCFGADMGDDGDGWESGDAGTVPDGDNVRLKCGEAVDLQMDHMEAFGIVGHSTASRMVASAGTNSGSDRGADRGRKEAERCDAHCNGPDVAAGTLTPVHSLAAGSPVLRVPSCSAWTGWLQRAEPAARHRHPCPRLPLARVDTLRQL